tara:strand:+ start:511 stop:927 length:417 start_codon:yes stop_codon:yes gene_type:complete
MKGEDRIRSRDCPSSSHPFLILLLFVAKVILPETDREVSSLSRLQEPFSTFSHPSQSSKMRFLDLLVAATAVSGVTIAPRQETANAYEEIENFTPEDDIARLALAGLANLTEFEETAVKSKAKRGGCSLLNVSIRRDW